MKINLTQQQMIKIDNSYLKSWTTFFFSRSQFYR